ncbi:MAG: sigma-70 family RNA polymerase sigma factor [Firmicutes bacterium]|nr:sigma-70 family RNA polymerase sigma factor [Bacillota bacterium]
MILQKNRNHKDATQFKIIFDDYFEIIVRFILKYVDNDLKIAQDIAQEGFIELWNSEISLLNDTHCKGFLYLTSKNKALNVIKHQRVKKAYLNNYHDFESERFYQNQVIEEETRFLVHKAINKLPEQSKKVILLRLEGYKQEDIAKELNISIDTVKYHRKQAYRMLRKSLKDLAWINILGLL